MQIATLRQYKSALRQLSKIADALEEYECKTVPRPVVDPIDAILFRMDQLNLQSKDLIPLIGSAPKVSEVLNRKRGLSKAMIRRLHGRLDIPLDVLMGGEK